MKELQELIDDLKSKSIVERKRAAAELGRLGNPKAGPHLIKALRDNNPHVRSDAAFALGLLGYKEAVTYLIDLLNQACPVLPEFLGRHNTGHDSRKSII